MESDIFGIHLSPSFQQSVSHWQYKVENKVDCFLNTLSCQLRIKREELIARYGEWFSLSEDVSINSKSQASVLMYNNFNIFALFIFHS